MSDNNLQDFVTSTAARSHITFGDVRRLQRNCLPTGITSRAEAEALICLNGKVGRADKTWAQWLVTSISTFAATRERHGVVADAGTVEWLERLLRTTTVETGLGRRIARELRREVARLQADASQSVATDGAPDDGAAPAEMATPETLAPETAAVETAAPVAVEPEPQEAHAPGRKAARKRTSARSCKRAKPAKPARRARPTCSNDPLTTLPPIWSSGMERHLRFQLAVPC